MMIWIALSFVSLSVGLIVAMLQSMKMTRRLKDCEEQLVQCHKTLLAASKCEAEVAKAIDKFVQLASLQEQANNLFFDARKEMIRKNATYDELLRVQSDVNVASCQVMLGANERLERLESAAHDHADLEEVAPELLQTEDETDTLRPEPEIQVAPHVNMMELTCDENQKVFVPAPTPVKLPYSDIKELEALGCISVEDAEKYRAKLPRWHGNDEKTVIS